MVSLIDIAPSRATVLIRGQDVEINGLSAEHIASILFTFPELRKLMTQDAVDREVVGSLITRMPEAVALIIAVGSGGSPDDEKMLAAAGNLTVGEQYIFLEAIVKETFPQTLKSFLDGVAALVNQSGGHGWVPGMKSPEQSNGASPPVASSATAGEAPQSS